MSEQKQIEAHYEPQPSVPAPLSFKDIRLNTMMIKNALNEIMVKDVDYGLIPGCGNKPGLFKAGAEKLAMLFKIALFPTVECDRVDGDYNYLVRTKAVHQPSGIELGEGVGFASTRETKYAWRKAICPNEFDSTLDENKRLKWTDNGSSIQQVRENPTDKQNTVLKMAAKRSMVDVVLKVCSASDIFNQGEDDIIVDVDQPRKPSRPRSTNGEQQKVESVPQGLSMISKREGICAKCQFTIFIGEEIIWNGKEKKAYHKKCPTKSA